MSDIHTLLTPSECALTSQASLAFRQVPLNAVLARTACTVLLAERRTSPASSRILGPPQCGLSRLRSTISRATWSAS
jgi:hypothetical protein